MNTQKHLDFAAKYQKSPGRVIDFLLRNPKIIVTLLNIVWAVIRFTFKFIYDKNGVKKPFWLRVGKFLGFGFAKELDEICDQCVEVNEVLIKNDL